MTLLWGTRVSRLDDILKELRVMADEEKGYTPKEMVERLVKKFELTESNARQWLYKAKKVLDEEASNTKKPTKARGK